MRFLAHLLSIALHPLFMPLYTLLLAFRLDPHLLMLLGGGLATANLLMVALMTVVFPLASTLLLLWTGSITSLRMPGREERLLPFTLTLFYYGLTYYMLGHSPHHPAVYGMMAGATIALLLTAAITTRWKISAHMVGMGGLLGALAALLLLHHTFAPMEMALLIVLAGALGSARILEGGHTPGQVYAGTVLGIACTFGGVMAYT
jgi:membrane-associated phospholipid phosphatase